MYVSPSLDVIKVGVEKGFATSVVNDYAEPGAAGMLQEGKTYEF